MLSAGAQKINFDQLWDKMWPKSHEQDKVSVIESVGKESSAKIEPENGGMGSDA